MEGGLRTVSRIPSYPKVHALGHYQIDGILENYSVVQEKYDGSQFSFGVIDGELVCKSKRKDLDLDNPEKLFVDAVSVVRDLFDEGMLLPGYIYRGEVLAKPKHNTLEYERRPYGGIVLFDVEMPVGQAYAPLMPTAVNSIAMSFGLEPAARLFPDPDRPLMDQVDGLLKTISSLGGVPIEGFVVKNYTKFTTDDKFMAGKFVSEAFKEKHIKNWKAGKPGRVELIQALGQSLNTEARWEKALQSLRDDGILEGSPRDIGALVMRVQADVLLEEGEWIKRQLFDHFWRQIRTRVTRGLPEWYKRKLLENAS
jgi:hypothetical protein